MKCDGCFETMIAPRLIDGIGNVKLASCPFCGTVYAQDAPFLTWRIAKADDFNEGDLETANITGPP